MAPDPSDNPAIIVAIDHLDPNGSVVKSGIAMAEAALSALEEAGTVRITLKGLKGASSSYFNAFLHRIEEGCGLAEIGKHIHLEFGSNIQEMVFQRSFESRAPRKPPVQAARPTTIHGRQSIWKRIFRTFGAKTTD